MPAENHGDPQIHPFVNMGASLSVMKDAFPPKPQFRVEDIPDLTGKVAIVTGANTGVGRETAKVSLNPRGVTCQSDQLPNTGAAQALLAHNAKVYLAARNQEKTVKVIEELKVETGKQGIFLKLDLGDLESVKAAAEEFLR